MVPDRRLGGRVGSRVVTPLTTPEGTVARAPWLRRWHADERATAARGDGTVLGTLGPGESPRSGPALPDGQRRGIDLARLVNEWPGDLYNVVLLASSESGHADAALARVPPPQAPDTPLNLRNLAYAVQWWVFGLFAIWMWWKMFRAEQQPATSEPAAPREDAT